MGDDKDEIWEGFISEKVGVVDYHITWTNSILIQLSKNNWKFSNILKFDTSKQVQMSFTFKLGLLDNAN
jgi:hypothetical protein